MTHFEFCKALLYYGKTYAKKPTKVHISQQHRDELFEELKKSFLFYRINALEKQNKISGLEVVIEETKGFYFT